MPTYTGDEGPNTYDGGPGIDIVYGRGGNDTLNGGGGDDALFGEGGDDQLNGGTGADHMEGGLGNDIYWVDDAGDVVIETGDGNHNDLDTVYTTLTTYSNSASIEIISPVDRSLTVALTFTSSTMGQTIYGNAGANGFISYDSSETPFGDVFIGLGGDDSYVVSESRLPSGAVIIQEEVGGGYDTVYVNGGFKLEPSTEIEVLTALDRSSTASVTLTGNRFAQTIYGGNGNDSLRGAGGADLIYGLGGDDSYVVDSRFDGGQEKIFEYAGGGNDTVYTTGSYALQAGAEIETLMALDRGETFALSLTGNALAQTIYGNQGVNGLIGGGGADRLIGLGGDDSYLITDANATVVEVLNGGTDTVYATVSYALMEDAAIETLTAYDRSGTDSINLTGSKYDNVIFGTNGDNRIDGKFGNDEIHLLYGADTIYFTTALAQYDNVDKIYGFATTTDKLVLDDAIFTGLTVGTVAANQFALGTGAADADDRIVYDQATGTLSYDADGNGAGAAIAFAQLEPGTVLASTDFFIV